MSNQTTIEPISDEMRKKITVQGGTPKVTIPKALTISRLGIVIAELDATFDLSKVAPEHVMTVLWAIQQAVQPSTITVASNLFSFRIVSWQSKS